MFDCAPINFGFRICDKRGAAIRNSLCRHICVSFIFCSLLSVLCDGVYAASHNNVSPRPSELRQDYVAEPKFCATLSKLQIRARKRYPRATYLTDLPSSSLEASGLRSPDWLSEDSPAVTAFPTGGTRFFWTQPFDDGAIRLVAVQSTPLGSHGDFVTSVWVAWPGKFFTMKTYRRVDGSDDEIAPDPLEVELLVDFSTASEWIPNYPTASLQNGVMHFSKDKPENTEAGLVVKDAFGALHAQEAVKFNGNIYFVVGAPMKGPVVAYRLNKNSTVQIECVAHWNE